MDEENQPNENSHLFSREKITTRKPSIHPPTSTRNPKPQHLEKEKYPNPNCSANSVSFSQLGLDEWAVETCKLLGMKVPTAFQRDCIPRILAGEDVMRLAPACSCRTAAFALPILHRLAEDPYGVFALVLTPTRELVYRLAEQFRALGWCLDLRCAVVVLGINMLNEAKTLMQRPHVVIATPQKIRNLIEKYPDIPAVFSKTKFLVLDEADRLLDFGYEEELSVVFQCLPKNRQTLFFYSTITRDPETLLEISENKACINENETYEGFREVESLKQQYVFTRKNDKDIFLLDILYKMEDMGTQSAIIFVSTCRSCHLLSLMLEELDLKAAAMHSFKSKSLRLAALHQFKSGQVPILLASDFAIRGLDIPTVDLVINFDIPRYPREYVRRFGRTISAGRGGLSISFVTQSEVDLIHEILAGIEKQLDKFECKENEVLADITKVYNTKMMDGGFEETSLKYGTQKLKTRKELFKKRSKMQKKEIHQIVESLKTLGL